MVDVMESLKALGRAIISSGGSAKEILTTTQTIEDLAKGDSNSNETIAELADAATESTGQFNE